VNPNTGLREPATAKLVGAGRHLLEPTASNRLFGFQIIAVTVGGRTVDITYGRLRGVNNPLGWFVG
jgi:hypothetical protein